MKMRSWRDWLFLSCLIFCALFLFYFIVMAAADKCADGEYQQGSDKETGAIICKPDNQTDPSQTNVMSQNVPPVTVDNSVDSGENFAQGGK